MYGIKLNMSASIKDARGIIITIGMLIVINTSFLDAYAGSIFLRTSGNVYTGIRIFVAIEIIINTIIIIKERVLTIFFLVRFLSKG